MEIIGDIVTLIARRSRPTYDRISDWNVSAMSDEDFNIPGADRGRLAGSDDVEEMLELLIKLAQTERRDFLAYLLRMAPIEAQNNAPDRTFLPH
jgi:hypothetical protein